MEFFTINQYFNRLNMILLSVILVPMVAFCILYVSTPSLTVAKSSTLYRYVCLSLVSVIWILIFFLFNKKIKTNRNLQGLGLKLRIYFQLTIVRYTMASAGCVLLAAGYYVTADEYLTILFVASLAGIIMMWPRPAKVCRDLRLRGDEREMVYFRKDSF